VLRRVLPRTAQLRERYILAPDEPIHRLLIPRIAGLDDDIVDERGETRIANQREPEGVPLLVAVRAFVDRHDVVRLEGIEDGRDRLHRHCRLHRRSGGTGAGGLKTEGQQYEAECHDTI
jgi:hypothetical protein